MLPVMPSLNNKALVWALNHMTVTVDETDTHGYIFRAEIKINSAMVRSIRQYIYDNHTHAQDSKYGNTFSIKFLNDAATEQEAYISISPLIKYRILCSVVGTLSLCLGACDECNH